MRTEQVTFDDIDMVYLYNAILGRGSSMLSRQQFMDYTCA
jgi:hypothetical protein